MCASWGLKMAVDVETRRILAGRLLALIHGDITNQEFDQGFDGESCWTLSDDPGVVAVATAAWFLYDDFKTQRFVGQQALPAATIQSFERAACFLKANGEYAWPEFPGRPWPASFAVAAVVLASVGVLVIRQGISHDVIIREFLLIAGTVLLAPFGYWLLTYRVRRRRYVEWAARGDIAVWPFLRRADWEAATVVECRDESSNRS